MEFCAWTLFHEVSKEILTQRVCHQALERPLASEEVDISKSKMDIRLKYAVLTICLEALEFLSKRGTCDHFHHFLTFQAVYLQLLKTTIQKR